MSLWAEGRSDLETVVAEVRRETADAVTIRLDLQGRPVPVPGRSSPSRSIRTSSASSPTAWRKPRRPRDCPKARRGYSLCSDPSEPGFVEISVRRTAAEVSSVLSPWIVRAVRVGQTIRIAGPFGGYHLPDHPPPTRSATSTCARAAASAPNRGMIRHALGRGWPHRTSWSSRTGRSRTSSTATNGRS
jgi:hypothetical protein